MELAGVTDAVVPNEHHPDYPVAQHHWTEFSFPRAHLALGHLVSIAFLSLKSGTHNRDICTANNEQLVIFEIKSL